MPFLRSYYLLLCLLFSPLLAGAQTHPDVAKLFERFKSAAAFDHEFPREKVFLHLDNNAYFEGDSLFYKAYVVRASSLKPTDISGVLYVELLNAAGQMMERQLVKIDSLGGGSGCIKFDSYMHSGYYEVRAYTALMLNWPDAPIFSRVFPIFNAPAIEGMGMYEDPFMTPTPQSERQPEMRIKQPKAEKLNIQRTLFSS